MVGVVRAALLRLVVFIALVLLSLRVFELDTRATVVIVAVGCAAGLLEAPVRRYAIGRESDREA